LKTPGNSKRLAILVKVSLKPYHRAIIADKTELDMEEEESFKTFVGQTRIP